MAACRACHGDRVEMRCLKQNVRGLVRHLAIFSTHDTGDAENARSLLTIRGIGDEQILGI